MKAPAAPVLLELTGPRGMTHLVSEEAMVAGRRVGRYATVCGLMVLATSLTTPGSGYCRRCASRRADR